MYIYICCIIKCHSSFYTFRSSSSSWSQCGSSKVWNVNSFDQWGVELGKVLGVKVRKYLSQARAGGALRWTCEGNTSKMKQVPKSGCVEA